MDIGGKQISFDKAFLCTATNHPYFGGGVAIAPTAEIAKPTIDLVVVERVNLFKILGIIFLLLQKKQMKSKISIILLLADCAYYQLFLSMVKKMVKIAKNNLLICN